MKPTKLSPNQLKLKAVLKPIVESILREQDYPFGTLISFPETREYGLITKSRPNGTITWQAADYLGKIIRTGGTGVLSKDDFAEKVRSKEIVIINQH